MLKIGKNSFTQVNEKTWNKSWSEAMTKCNHSKSFHIMHCISLISIQIGQYSFSDFAGEFELTNLPQLQSIQIGTIGRKSCNFLSNSFVIGCNDMTMNI